MSEQMVQRCFAIMPFSRTTEKHTEEYWNNHYNNFLKVLIEAHSLTAFRSSPLRGDILRQIITDLVTTPIVIADLTDSNPNVYWELGVRQSFKHGTITIAEYGTNLPFDLGIKGTLFYYPDNHIKMSEFTSQLNDAINDCINNPSTPDSHVLETISGRGTMFQILMKDESIRKLDAILSEIKENSRILNDCKRTYEKNAILRKEKNNNDMTVITNRLRVIALDNLIVNRYVDAPNEFYDVLEDHRSDCVSINSQADFCDLGDDPELGEAWILSEIKGIKKTLNIFKKLVIEQRNKIILSQ
jgi:hypothetical protein